MCSELRIYFEQQMNMIGHCFHFQHVNAHFLTNLRSNLFKAFFYFAGKYFPAVFYTPNDVKFTRIDNIVVCFISHKNIIQPQPT